MKERGAEDWPKGSHNKTSEWGVAGITGKRGRLSPGIRKSLRKNH